MTAIQGMPHKDRHAGTFILDRRLGKLGRLKLASGTDDQEEFKSLNSMITTFKRGRKWDTLALLTQRILTPMELLDARDDGTLDQLPSPDCLLPVQATVGRWLKTADLAPRTKDDYETRLAALRGKMYEIPAQLVTLRGHAVESGKRQTFDNVLMAVRALLRDVPGLKRLLADIPAPLNPPHRPGNPQEPADIRALAIRFPYPAELWSLCLSGMRRGEYFPPRADWECLADRIRIGGTKTAAARRVVPLVYRLTAPRIAYSTFYKALVRESDAQLNVHDLRKTAISWWENAGVPDWRRKLYSGHSRGGLDSTYMKPRDLTRYLVEDAERVREWLGDPPQLGLKAVSA